MGRFADALETKLMRCLGDEDVAPVHVHMPWGSSREEEEATPAVFASAQRAVVLHGSPGACALQDAYDCEHEKWLERGRRFYKEIAIGAASHFVVEVARFRWPPLGHSLDCFAFGERRSACMARQRETVSMGA
jgi:hypothetical protein